MRSLKFIRRPLRQLIEAFFFIITDTYEKALERIEKLKTSAYAYTSDTDVDPLTKSEKATQEIMKKSTKALFDITEINESNDNFESNYSGTFNLFRYVILLSI